MNWLQLITAFVLFLLGIYLSAFFSGSEIGFYRLSYIRLTIDSHAGDRIAKRLLWFAQHPSYFVATTLVGNNVSNYMITLAIGLLASDAVWMEIVATLLISPIVFVFAELMPKNLYYRAPMTLLRRDSKKFIVFFRLFLVITFPLIWISKLFERFEKSENRTLELVLGRKRLVQVLSHGHQQGLLTDVQNRLIHGLLHTATQPIGDSMIPANRVLGVDDDTSRQETIEYARRYGVSSVAVKCSEAVASWYGYVRVVDLVVSQKPLSALIRKMPRLESSSNKLEALLALRSSGQAYGVVCDGATNLGTISERGLIEQMLRSEQTVVPHIPSSR